MQWDVPPDPTPLFRKPQDRLEDLYGRVKGDPSTKIQKRLWLEQLRGSGNHPIQRHEDALFVTHTLLTLISRMISGKKVPKRADHAGQGLLAGYVSWAGGDLKALRDMQKVVEKYDWSSNQGDLLRSIYKNLVAKTHRSIYGEYYTPDWLAEKVCLDVIDDAYIRKQLDNFANGDPLSGIIDPACGSGAFLYHAGKRLMGSRPVADAMEKGMLKEHELKEFVLRMICGIDIHPVAVEMAIANMHRLLDRVDPDSIRIYQGDSLLIDHKRSASTMDAHFETINTKEYLILQSPLKKTLRLPLSFVRNHNNTTKLVNAAVSGTGLPQSILGPLSEGEKRHVRTSFETLKEIIDDEGNGVWAWYIKNQAAPLLISSGEKSGRIVANPPWVRMNKIRDRGRASQMLELGKTYKVYVGGKKATSFDIASAFVLRSMHLYLAGDGKAGWVLPRAAIIGGGQWEKMRKIIGPHSQVDLGSLAFPENATSCYVVTGGKTTRHEFQKRKARLSPEDTWADARRKIIQRKVVLKEFIPSPSDFTSKKKKKATARQGAIITPSNLVIPDITRPKNGSTWIRTMESRHGAWKRMGTQEGLVPSSWLRPCVFTEGVSAFCVTRRRDVVLPVSDDGEWLRSRGKNKYWKMISQKYSDKCGSGSNTPQTIEGQLEYSGKLSSQFRQENEWNVVYNTSGERLYAAVLSSTELIDSSVYRVPCESKSEAYYLAGILTSDAIQEAVTAFKSSERHIHTRFWLNIPIARYNPSNATHKRIAGLARRAEAESLRYFDRGFGTQKMRKTALDAVRNSGIMKSLDTCVEKILPKYTVSGASTGTGPIDAEAAP